eukprot:g1473.t1
MRSKNLVPDVISYNSAISSCQANSDWHDALQFLDEMYLSSVPVDRISYNAVLSCCFAASQWQKVFQLLDAMVAAGMAGFTASRYDHQSQAGSALEPGLYAGAPLANRQYMGSACLSLLYLRPHDEAVCFEYASEMKSELVQNFDRMKSDCHGRTRVFQETRQPYDEYMAWNLYVMRHVYHAWPGSCIAVWYPCFTDEQTESFYLQLQHLEPR